MINMSNKVSNTSLNKQDILENAIPLVAKKKHRLLKSVGITIVSLSGLVGLGILGRKRLLF
ncbi:hypothetical protein CYJ89_06290 [Lactobacillus jensenii]|jgi:hypothetical protein|uniref:Uncharacterized protein n=2 Tax=Lactobacillus jensenii TaxID=109790 RepID=A0A5N1I7H7_LACJE|nr:hypothetical protein BUE77_05000 [Lactobacillus jensenii]EEQ69111.1 hypothetical protein LBJG_01539 [Lactobacillus jensenii 1153]EEX27511.1 hypothetical protein HMPREF0527_00563 [Lactobacillus jensenii SJ-7A-US]KRM49561.1 hypothetical protein FC45_GL000759 [Lactobacillus jensenii DSM 20557]KAA9235490.1 hypothetical protein F6I36_05710 [Lactobacillus jensenii]